MHKWPLGYRWSFPKGSLTLLRAELGPPQNSYVEVSIPNVTALVDRVIMAVIKVK